MITLKLPAGDIVRVEDGVWHADDPTIEAILNDRRRSKHTQASRMSTAQWPTSPLNVLALSFCRMTGPSQLFDPGVVY
jgi:hypothetical protein